MNEHNGMTRRSPDEIEREIAHTRSEIEGTLGQLQQDLSFGHLAERAFTLVRSGGGDLAGNIGQLAQTVGRAARENPIPIALIGVGLTWLALGPRNEEEAPLRRPRRFAGEDERAPPYEAHGDEASGDAEEPGGLVAPAPVRARAKDRFEETKERAERRIDSARHSAQERYEGAKERYQGAKARAGRSYEGAKERAARAGERARQSARRASAVARDRAAQASSMAKERFEEQPLLLGVLGLLVGALIGATLPKTRREQRMLGPARDRFVARADQLAAEQLREVGERVERSSPHGEEETKEALHEALEQAPDRAEDEARRREGGAPEVEEPV